MSACLALSPDVNASIGHQIVALGSCLQMLTDLTLYYYCPPVWCPISGTVRSPSQSLAHDRGVAYDEWEPVGAADQQRSSGGGESSGGGSTGSTSPVAR